MKKSVLMRDPEPSRAGTKAEKKLSKRLGGKLMPASGALEGAKGDIDLPTFKVESKSTVKNSISLKKEWLDKISQEAVEMNTQPALAILFTDEEGEIKRHGSWVAIPEYVFQELMEK